MPITIIAVGMPQAEAEQYFDSAKSYLIQSNLAAFIFQQLENMPETLTIKISRNGASEWDWRDENETNSAGIITWNLSQTLATIDRQVHRPDVTWTSSVDDDVINHMTPALILLHEMGHAMQFMTNKAEFMARIPDIDFDNQDDPILLDIENINVNAIENTVALELIDKGFTEGVRWKYRHHE